MTSYSWLKQVLVYWTVVRVCSISPAYHLSYVPRGLGTLHLTWTILPFSAAWSIGLTSAEGNKMDYWFLPSQFMYRRVKHSINKWLWEFYKAHFSCYLCQAVWLHGQKGTLRVTLPAVQTAYCYISWGIINELFIGQCKIAPRVLVYWMYIIHFINSTRLT